MIEQKIAQKLVDGLLDAGFTLDVNDGEETVLRASTDRKAILESLGSTDYDVIRCRNKKNNLPIDGYVADEVCGWVMLVWGNEVDLISGYTCNIERYIQEAVEYAETFID